jgi:hypothetical protein
MGKSSFKTAGFYSKRAQEMNRPPKGGSWVWLTMQLIGSAAFRSLSINALRALFRILAEHSNQDGQENGRLKITSRDMEIYGIHHRFRPKL